MTNKHNETKAYVLDYNYAVCIMVLEAAIAIILTVSTLRFLSLFFYKIFSPVQMIVLRICTILNIIIQNYLYPIEKSRHIKALYMILYGTVLCGIMTLSSFKAIEIIVLALCLQVFFVKLALEIISFGFLKTERIFVLLRIVQSILAVAIAINIILGVGKNIGFGMFIMMLSVIQSALNCILIGAILSKYGKHSSSCDQLFNVALSTIMTPSLIFTVSYFK